MYGAIHGDIFIYCAFSTVEYISTCDIEWPRWLGLQRVNFDPWSLCSIYQHKHATVFVWLFKWTIHCVGSRLSKWARIIVSILSSSGSLLGLLRKWKNERGRNKQEGKLLWPMIHNIIRLYHSELSGGEERLDYTLLSLWRGVRWKSFGLSVYVAFSSMKKATFVKWCHPKSKMRYQVRSYVPTSQDESLKWLATLVLTVLQLFTVSETNSCYTIAESRLPRYLGTLLWRPVFMQKIFIVARRDIPNTPPYGALYVPWVVKCQTCWH